MKDAACKRVTLRDIADATSPAGKNFQVRDRGLLPDAAVLEGTFRLMRLRSGLVLHATDTVEAHDLDSQMEHAGGLTCYLFLDGNIDLTIGGHPMDVGRRGGEIEAVLVSHPHTDIFRRRSSRGERVRKVNVSLSEEWLQTGGLDGQADHAKMVDFSRDHLAAARWRPSRRLVALAEQILNPPSYEGGLQALYLESRAIEIVAEAMQALTNGDPVPVHAELGPRERKRLKIIDEFLDFRLDGVPTLDEIAAQAGVSVNTLQRLFQSAYGTTVFHHVRSRKLDRARVELEREGVSISEAAFGAGYSSPANFATAFKRRFGLSPKHVRARS